MVFPNLTTEELVEALREQHGVFAHCEAVDRIEYTDWASAGKLTLPWTISSEVIRANDKFASAKVDLVPMVALHLGHDLLKVWKYGNVKSSDPLLQAFDGTNALGIPFKESKLLLSGFTKSEYRVPSKTSNNLDHCIMMHLIARVVPKEK